MGSIVAGIKPVGCWKIHGKLSDFLCSCLLWCRSKCINLAHTILSNNNNNNNNKFIVIATCIIWCNRTALCIVFRIDFECKIRRHCHYGFVFLISWIFLPKKWKDMFVFNIIN
jgi:hypothetical protein